jgi:hypothetical protein
MPPQGGPARKKRRQKVRGHVTAPSNPPSGMNVAGSSRLLSCPPAQRGHQLVVHVVWNVHPRLLSGSASPTFESHPKYVRVSATQLYLEHVTHVSHLARSGGGVLPTGGLDSAMAGSSNYLDLPVEGNFVIGCSQWRSPVSE